MNTECDQRAKQVLAGGLAAVKDFYRALTFAGVGDIASVYHPQVVFIDPAGTVEGLDALRRHFERLMENVQTCTCEFTDECELAGDDSAVLFWRMTIRAPALAGGKAFAFDGVSHLRFCDGLVIMHRDYFDMGAMLYENLPVLGGIIRRLRRRMEKKP